MENGIANLSHHLPTENFDLHVCCIRTGGIIGERLKHPSQLYEINKPPGFSFRCVKQLRKITQKLQPDIIHTHNLGPLIYASLSTCMGKKWKILHGEHAELFGTELSLRRKKIRKLMYRRCRAIHCVSAQLTKQIASHGFGHENLHTIPNGVDTSKFTPAYDKSRARDKLPIKGITDDSFLIGVVGRFGPMKGHSLLLQAFEELASRQAQPSLIIAGDGGPEKARILQQISKSKYKDRIHWLGFQKNMVAVYQAIDLLVSPSFNEGMSNAVLEAMACSVPVLANKACGNSEILSRTGGGTVSSMERASDLAEQLACTLRNKDQLNTQGAAGREAVNTVFSISKMADNYGALYHSLACQ
ncbi:MAG: glycosyltransferase family 4 protein [Verrucomicrobiales bacterium]|nr:glycosyltransferase family 4 protein [Verrucomicrobiales bacterium]